jgi:hypothetical protein
MPIISSLLRKNIILSTLFSAYDGAVCWGTALQAGRYRVRLPMVLLEFFIDIILPPNYGLGVYSACNGIEYQEYVLWGKGGRCIRLTNLHFMCRLSWNLGASNSYKTQSVYRTLQRILYLSPYSLTTQDVLFSSTKAVTRHINSCREHCTIQCESILFICPFVRIRKKLGSESADLPTYLTCIYT